MKPDTLAGAQHILLPALEQAIDAVVLIDEHNAVTFFNRAAERLWGYERADVLGRNVKLLVPRAIQPAHDDYIASNRNTGANKIVGTNREIRIERKDGSETWGTFSLSKIDVGGRIHYMAFARDVSAEVAQREENRLLLLAINHTDRIVFVLDHERRIVHVNRAFTERFGYSLSEAIGRVPTEFLTSERNDPVALSRLRSNGWDTKDFHEEIIACDKEGKDIWVSASINPIVDTEEPGIVKNVVVVLSDITESKEIQNLQRDVLEALASDLSLQDVSDLLCRRVEAIAPDVISSILLIDGEKKIRPLAGPNLPDHYTAALDGVEIGEGVGSCGTAAYRGEPVEVTDIETDPLWAPYKMLALPIGLRACWSSPIKRRDGSVAGTFAFYFREKRSRSPIHEQVVKACVHLCMLAIEHHESREQIARLAHFDSLTGLPNRTRLHEYIDALLPTADDGGVAFFALDLDHFKDVNNALGHPAGDTVLIGVANRLEKLFQANGIVSRTGEDTFVIVAPDCNVQRASALAEKILQRLKASFDISGVSLNVTASIGISLYADNGRDRETLLGNADTAMHRAKAAGRGSYLFFSPEMNLIAQDRLVLGAALRSAIANDLLRLHYQPQVRPQDGTLYGVEALARWSDPDLGDISPRKFIALAEEIGEIEAIGHWSLEEACRQMAEWRKAGLGIPRVSVNLSPLHFRNRDLPGFIAGLLGKYQLPPDCLTVEITESVMMDQRPEPLEIVRAIRSLGVGLSMDDFGTGFSSLSSLAHLPITELKIDRSFMQDFETDQHAQALATAVVRIGQSLGLTVVAEGVETEAQRRLLTDRDCHVVQGYLFSRPVSPSQLEDWMKPQIVASRRTGE
ncbi:MAG TPA: oxygen-sensing cyclic-di-GMP phosphodiesterase DosP [Rhizobium sp.]